MPTVTVRKATQADLKIMKAILNDAVIYKLSKNDEAWGSEAWTDAEVAEAISFGNTHLVLLDNVIVGCVDLIWQDSYNWGETLGTDGLAGYLHRLAVLGDYKGKDLGSEIINWVAAQAKQKGRQYVRLDCRANNKSLCAYYEKQGFTLVKPNNPKSQTAAYYQKSI